MSKIDVKFALVTGGAGFIGSHLVDRLVLEGWSVRIVDNFSSGRMENVEHHRGNRRVEILRGDLKSPKEAEEAVKGVDVVFHYAANPEVRLSTTNPDVHFNENVVATFNLLEAMRKSDVEQLVFASSSSVYGEPESIPVSEDAPIKPVSVYGASKAACENLIHAYCNLYGLKAVVLRHGVIYDFIVKLCKNPKQLEILGDGTQKRSYIYIDDAVEATMIAYNAAAGKRFEVFNVGNEDYITVKEVADIVVDALKLRGVKYVYKPVDHGVGWRGDVKNIALSIDKIKSQGFKPQLDSRQSCKKDASELIKSQLNVRSTIKKDRCT